MANGELARIDEAVMTGLNAVGAAGPVHQIAILTATATALHNRYLDTDALPDLRQAISLERRAAALADAIPGSEAALLSTLADSLTSLYLRTEDDAVGRDAVDVQRQALAAATPGSELHTEISYELACTMFARFRGTRDRGDFDAAIQAAEAGMQIRAEERGDIARRHGLVALTHQLRHELSADVDDLRRAAEAYEAGASACADDDPTRASYLLSSADMLMRLFEATADDTLADRATALHRAAAAIATAPVADRLRATVGWAEGEARGGRYDAAVVAYQAAIRLLPLTAWHGLERGDREYLLSLSAGMASDAAAAAIALDEPELALELLEEGRGVLLRQAFDYRRGPAQLRERHPELAAELETVRRRLDAATGRGAADGLIDRRVLAQRWDALVAEARSLAGFDDFLMPTPFERLRAAAGCGPVVVVNISELRCDAMVLTKAGVSVVPLPDVTPEAVNEQAGRLDSALDSAAHDPLAPQTQLTLVLTWLGTHVVAPLLGKVAPRRRQGEPLTRAWWCPTGVLSSMPLHAALLPGGEVVFERCIPSYTATLRTLLNGREPATTEAARPLVVGVASSAEGSTLLPSAGAEIAIVAPSLEGAAVLREEAATCAAVLDGLPAASWFHFAGHAEQRSWQDGGPVLHCWDGPLAATDIAMVALDRAEIAVLSACDTAFGDVELRDEAAHLSGAFQIAGFRHVVATQWPVNDRRARVAVRTFYRHVTGDAKTSDAAHAAVAVWQVLRDERAAYPDRPAIWAPFVHFGP
ncbi:CHAT domain-containing protein [Amycolatopsis sp. NPDC051758]|uniref:CHAT domain-containing protein n=1 Tax=Amycolatopsis sp. NPDC051758 TaxID=3363935 RepID=UPI0037A79E19